MITTVCANPCIDDTIIVEELKLGIVNRVIKNRIDASGKGINVAIVLKRLGYESKSIGFNYVGKGDLIQERVRSNNVPFEFITCDGAVRTNYKIINEKDSKMTEINENGGFVNEPQKKALLELAAAHAKSSEMIIFSGSLPMGCDDNFYKDLILACGDAKCVLDTEGKKFGIGLDAKPFLVKPNQFELSLYVGRELEETNEILSAALEIVKKGVKIVAVSLGGKGALITDGEKAYLADSVSVVVKSTVGAGDSFVAALCMGIAQKKSLKEAFAMGMAGGTGCVITEGTQLVTLEAYNKYLPMIKVHELQL